ncbi:MAG: protein-export chaperone SecB [Gammaproteobacteria bacterium]|jgi:preprotein translocase subunit SecB
MSDTDQNTAAGNQGPDSDKYFALQRVYLKDCSFESPNAPAIFEEDWQPMINLNLRSEVTTLRENVHEVVLSATVEAKMEERTAFLAEVHQAAVFEIRGFDEEELRSLLRGFAPNQIFPYVRETVCNMVTSGGFPQLLLQPVNFELLYQREQMQAQEQTGGEAQA